MRSLFVLALTLCPALTLASPGIRLLKPADIDAQTDAMVQLTIVKRTVSQLDVKPPIQVTIIEARVESATGRKAAAVPAGTALRFKAQCSLDTTPIVGRMLGYPNTRCGSAWTALPVGFSDATVKTVEARLIVRDDGTVLIVPTTHPQMGSLGGTIVPAKPTP